MRVTKYGHACSFIDNGEKKLIIDPGKFTKLPDNLQGIGIIIVSEEHYDHFNIQNIKKILRQSPKALIFTTDSVGNTLAEENIQHETVSGEKIIDESGFQITLSEGDHAIVYGNSPCRILTVGVDNFLYYPSDSFTPTDKAYAVLALPTSGPWYKLSESVDFANKIKSNFILVTHNSLLSEAGNEATNSLIGRNISDKSREWVYLKDGESKDFS